MHSSIYCVFNTDLLLEVSGSLCKFPEDGDYTETCSSKISIKYPIHRKVHLFVLIEFVIQFLNARNEKFDRTHYKSTDIRNLRLLNAILGF